MAKLHADPAHAEAVASRLSTRGFPHLRARKRGELILIESGPDDDPVPHARLRRDTIQLWRLEIPTHTGRWEPTGIRAPLKDMIEVLVQDLPWVLTPIV